MTAQAVAPREIRAAVVIGLCTGSANLRSIATIRSVSWQARSIIAACTALGLPPTCAASSARVSRINLASSLVIARRASPSLTDRYLGPIRVVGSAAVSMHLDVHAIVRPASSFVGVFVGHRVTAFQDAPVSCDFLQSMAEDVSAKW